LTKSMKTYVINLDRREDRKEQMQGKFPGCIRVPAVDGSLWDGTGWKKQGVAKESYWKGAAGCYFSHVKALETAIAENIFPCLILEDDALFLTQPSAPKKMTRYGGWSVKDRMYGAHAFGYEKKEDAEMYLCYLKSRKNIVDSVAYDYQTTYPDRVTTDIISTQEQDYSDILGTVRIHGTKREDPNVT